MYQQKLIERHFKFLNCKIKKTVLVCAGTLKLANCRNIYSILIEYVAGYEPKTTILSPNIMPCQEIHMYQDHSLCLHYPKDMVWNERTLIFKYTVPWISEWIYYYEIYLINGNVWEGPESPLHFTEAERNINMNIE